MQRRVSAKECSLLSLVCKQAPFIGLYWTTPLAHSFYLDGVQTLLSTLA